MPQLATIKFMGAYQLRRRPLMFLSSFFSTGARDRFNSESVRIHVRRHGQRVAVTVVQMSSEPRWGDIDQHSVKDFTPYPFNEGFSISGDDVRNVQFGREQFDEPQFIADALLSFSDNAIEREEAIMRAVELMCSQILQTGTVTLIDANGTTLGSMDFKPKATHFPQVTTSWVTTATAVPLTDIESLCDQILASCGRFPEISLSGSGAFRNAMKITSFQDHFDKRRMDLGTMMPREINSKGAKYQGELHLGSHKIEIWTYPQSYDAITDSANTPYIGADNFIVMAPQAELRLLYGGFPGPLVRPDPRVAPFRRVLPRRVSNGGYVDLSPNVWCSPDGETVYGSIRSRPQPVPVEIDSFGCINTVQA